MFRTTVRIFGGLPLSRFERVEKYVKNIEENIKLKDKKDIEIAKEIKKLIKERVKAMRYLTWTSYVLYLLIYFSFVSLVLREFVFLSEVAKILNYILSIVGTTVLVIITYGISRLKELYYTDLTLLSSHFISIYSKAGFKEEKDMFSEKNEYEIFINFFKKRGFMKRE